MNWSEVWQRFENWSSRLEHDPTPPKGKVTEALWKAFMHYTKGVDVEDIPRLRSPDNVLYCVVGSSAGRYVPQRFAEKFAVPDRDRDILLEGPDHEHYWEAWDDVLREFKIENETFGTEVFFIGKGGDVFAVRDDISEVESYLYLSG